MSNDPKQALEDVRKCCEFACGQGYNFEAKETIVEFMDRFIGLETDGDRRDGMNEFCDVVRPIIERLVNERDEAVNQLDAWKICAGNRLKQIVKLEQENEAMAECVNVLRYLRYDDCYNKQNHSLFKEWQNQAEDQADEPDFDDYIIDKALANLDVLKGGQG